MNTFYYVREFSSPMMSDELRTNSSIFLLVFNYLYLTFQLFKLQILYAMNFLMIRGQLHGSLKLWGTCNVIN